MAAKNWILLLVDSQNFTRQCLADLLRKAADDLTIVEAAHPDQVSAEVLGGCDIVLVGGGDPVEASLDAVLRLHRRRPALPVAVIGTLQNAEEGLAVVRQGIRGYLSPAMSVRQIVAALRLVRDGGSFIGPSPASAAVPAPVRIGVSRVALPAPAMDDLTPRERDVLAQLKTGKPNKLIAYELNISENTVKVHVGRLLKKLKAPNRTAVVGLPPDQATVRGPAGQTFWM